MAKQPVNNEQKPSLLQRIKDFFSEVRTEMDKVTWPTKDDLKVSTKVTMYMLGTMAAVVFLFDQVFNKAILLLFSAVS